MELEKEVENLVSSLRFFQEKSATLNALQERVKSALSDVTVKLKRFFGTLVHIFVIIEIVIH